MHNAQFTMHNSQCIIHNAKFIIHNISIVSISDYFKIKIFKLIFNEF